MAGAAKPHASFIEQRTASLIVSAVKPPEDGDGLIVRLWNPTAQRQTDTLTLWRPVQRAELIELSEAPAEGPSPEVRGNSVTVRAEPHQIVTLRLALG